MQMRQAGNNRKSLRTSDIARELGVHVNTIRLYEREGFLPPVPRDPNGYRRYSILHLEYARLVHLTISWPYLGKKTLLIELATRAAQADFGMAMELAYQYLARIRMERTVAESAVEFLEHWAAGHLLDVSTQTLHIGEAAEYLDVTIDMLRNWERNGLLHVPRDPENGYRRYGAAEFGRIRVIRMLIQSGYSLMAILRMLRRFDAGQTDNLRAALDVENDPDDDEAVQMIADRWLAGLHELETRAQTIIRQISRLIEMTHGQR